MLAWYAIAGDEVRVCLFLLCLWCNKVVPRGDGGKGPGGGMLRRTEVAKKTSE